MLPLPSRPSLVSLIEEARKNWPGITVDGVWEWIDGKYPDRFTYEEYISELLETINRK